VRQARQLIAQLEDRGYVPVACRSAVKLTFALRSMLDDEGASPALQDDARERPAPRTAEGRSARVPD
jgi:hypothetical protein